jgi:gluconokinase
MILIVIGPSASGKSTLGEALARALGWPFVEGDDFHPEANKARMRAGIALTDADRAPWLAALARSIESHAASGTSAVYACSALKRTYRARLVPAGTGSGQVRFVYLDVPRAVLAQRLAHRRGHDFPASLLDSQLRDLEPPRDAEPAPTLCIDGTRTVEENVGEVLARLGLAAG